MDEFYRVPLSSAEALATLAALRALDALEKAGALDSEIEPGILESAAARVADEVPDFVEGQAAGLARALVEALRAAAPGGGEAQDAWDRDEPPFPVARSRRLLRDAAERELPVEIEYFVTRRREWTARRVDISDVFERDGTWYVSGHCGLRADHRLFRLDHIRSVRLLDAGELLADPFEE